MHSDNGTQFEGRKWKIEGRAPDDAHVPSKGAFNQKMKPRREVPGIRTTPSELPSSLYCLWRYANEVMGMYQEQLLLGRNLTLPGKWAVARIRERINLLELQLALQRQAACVEDITPPGNHMPHHLKGGNWVYAALLISPDISVLGLPPGDSLRVAQPNKERVVNDTTNMGEESLGKQADQREREREREGDIPQRAESKFAALTLIRLDSADRENPSQGFTVEWAGSMQNTP
ncbi:hypothetical protein PR048_014109 [Dryococelus australis]|uniref:Integrase catalytic domain-containing protein n=1 Tax=Dryococelus australis TaxID=614101 RepID=A0ABQ9HDI3_9NEOP|nr:hypothetical protein PR048_014109 [Dryococelus australis]